MSLYPDARRHGLSGTLLRPVQNPVAARPFALRQAPAELAEIAEETPSGRSKIWELSPNLHCSIIGTCLATDELRQLLVKLNATDARTATDHELHGLAVTLASRRDAGAKIIQKALDRRHSIAINQFRPAKSAEDVRALWDQAAGRGEIPGAYWAVLTHQATTAELVRYVFGQVHMLSHLVGAANRADIRRLMELEADNAELREKVARQQTQLRDAIICRDAKIRDLERALASRVAAQEDDATADLEADTLLRLVAQLQKQLSAEIGRRERFEQKLEAEITAHNDQRRRCQAAERDVAELRDELGALDEKWTVDAVAQAEKQDLRGLKLLYVGGRPSQVPQLARVAESANAELLHHDGGVEDRAGLLAGLVSQAEIVLFPVDCISHDAALTVKRLCQKSGKSFVPLRSNGVTSFLSALSRIGHPTDGVSA